MIIAIYNTFLTLFINPKAVARPNPATGEPVTSARERIESLVDYVSARSGLLIIPAPALAEVMCVADATNDYLEKIESYSCIEVAAFDTRASVDFGKTIRAAKALGDKRSGVLGNWQHLKMDRQIVAIAKSRGASTLYTDDGTQEAFARLAGLDVKHTWDLPLSPERAQISIAETEQWPKQKKQSNEHTSSKPPAS